MITHWTIDQISRQERLFLDSYVWDEPGAQFEFVNEDATLRVRITFPVTVECISVRYLEKSLSYEDDVRQFIIDSRCATPVYPFFILSESELITKVINTPYSDHSNKKFLQYTMIACDMWVDVVSSVPPQISVQKS